MTLQRKPPTANNGSRRQLQAEATNKESAATDKAESYDQWNRSRLPVPPVTTSSLIGMATVNVRETKYQRRSARCLLEAW